MQIAILERKKIGTLLSYVMLRPIEIDFQKFQNQNKQLNSVFINAMVSIIKIN
jgi:RNAse (barnase) inhibitor barstar